MTMRAVTMERTSSEMKAETGGCADPHLPVATYFGCFNGAVRSVWTQTGMEDMSMEGDVKVKGGGEEGRDSRRRAKQVRRCVGVKERRDLHERVGEMERGDERMMRRRARSRQPD